MLKKRGAALEKRRRAKIRDTTRVESSGRVTGTVETARIRKGVKKSKAIVDSDVSSESESLGSIEESDEESKQHERLAREDYAGQCHRTSIVNLLRISLALLHYGFAKP